ncbi:MAG: hypothetical protein ACNA7Y_01125 [Gammaproteobacteria bacterium]
MNYFFIKIAFISSLALLSMGCSLLDKGKNAITQKKAKIYLHAQSAPPLQVPPGIPEDSVGDMYSIPATTKAASNSPPSLLPPDSLADKIAQGKISPDVLKQKPGKQKK